MKKIILALVLLLSYPAMADEVEVTTRQIKLVEQQDTSKSRLVVYDPQENCYLIFKRNRDIVRKVEGPKYFPGAFLLDIIVGLIIIGFLYILFTD